MTTITTTPDTDDLVRTSADSNDAVHHKGQKSSSRHDSKQHLQKESQGELEMVVDPVDSEAPIKIEKKVHHEETGGGHSHGGPHNHKQAEADNHRPHHEGQHGDQAHHHSRENHNKDESHHEHHHGTDEHGITTNSAIHLPSDEEIRRLAGEDSTNRGTRRHHHVKPSVKVVEESETISNKESVREHEDGPRTTNHEVRHHDEHTHHHKHSTVHEEESTISDSFAAEVRPDEATQASAVKEEFLTVLPVIPDDMKAKNDEINEAEETTDSSGIVDREDSTTLGSEIEATTMKLTEADLAVTGSTVNGLNTEGVTGKCTFSLLNVKVYKFRRLLVEVQSSQVPLGHV